MFFNHLVTLFVYFASLFTHPVTLCRNDEPLLKTSGTFRVLLLLHILYLSEHKEPMEFIALIILQQSKIGAIIIMYNEPTHDYILLSQVGHLYRGGLIVSNTRVF